MPRRLTLRTATFAAAGLTLALPGGAALAHDGPHAGHRADGRGQGPEDRGYPREARLDPAREAWLADCRRHAASRDKGLGGAAIGGVVGGVAGNRLAGPGNRTIGTVAGAAVGAVAGAAIDVAEDSGRVRDQCEAYLDDYYANYYRNGYPGAPAGYSGYPQAAYGASYAGGPYPAPAYPGYYAPAYGYPTGGCCSPAPVMMVPVASAQPQCTETVEYVYEDVPVRPKARRAPVRHTKVQPDKRIRVAPDKRISTK